jgi:Bc2l-C, N-terminal domain
MAFYAQTSSTQQTNSATLVPIPGLSLEIPEGVSDSALVILNLPNPYASGNNFPGGFFGISVNGAVSDVVGCFTSSVQNPGDTGRVPTTLIVSVPLANAPQTIVALWSGVRGSTAIIDTPATLSAILD